MMHGAVGDTESNVRYAVYWAPDPQHPLAPIAHQWLFQPEPEVPIREPAQYGFHATLKPPFRLAAGQTEFDLLGSVQALAIRHQAFELPRLQVAWLNGFLALRPIQPLDRAHPLWSLADACVTELDEFRRPPNELELARRRALGLDHEQEALLLRWGYPHLLQRWRFHMTLTDKIPARQQQEQALQDRLRRLFEPALTLPLHCAAICIFRQAAPGQNFEAYRRLSLGDPRDPQ